MTNASRFARRAASALALLLGASAALAEDGLNRDIDSAVPEAEEDCEALRDTLAARNDDGRLDAFDMQELARKGC